ncbi:class I SAM-dependent methyltransferase [Longimicrobium terrae]|uniref:Ubiquinone/menaquinone biosynthesis C-methylase UbiE n=1 Tax=Longimicrobium terrae TaxID=1639882 RepID=A0A841H665_9BACT|nr:class I SAM-dependent methyltransferase [Longimicrobium terrae]MBB4638200.1 ubiquinone/menaquinone biosynthesis C-methylase UbiE [Longimicrobium terrae]MBB6073641.1 ubiquinone/menaquinone biosynthesis C-methylase UbiE [Longimicrobium terrae]NNC30320.1 methyltransferase domain-containing protein [Longimicrobium terrae]
MQPPSSPVRRDYDAAAARYDRRWARYNHDSLALLRPWLAGQALGRVLDVGCGTGNLARALYGWGARVDAYVGVDLSPEMLRAAADKAGAGGFAAGSAAALPVAEGAFHTVVSASTLHDWPDADAGARELRRALHTGGRLLLLDWNRAHFRMRFLNAGMRLTRQPYRRMYSTAEMRAILLNAGFRVLREARGGSGPVWRLAALEAAAV